MRIASLFPFLVLVACSTGSGGASSELAFHGEQAALPGFAFDTGLQPAGSPVQVALSFSSGGKITADAQALAGGPADKPVVVGKPGSGKLGIDVHFKLKSRLKVDVASIHYDGDVPGVDAVDVAFGASTMFEPFLLDGKATATANIPETKLPPIPLQSIGVPGNLVLTIAQGSTLASDFHGTCAAIADGKAHYVGATSTSGKILVRPSVEINVPIVGTKTFDIPMVTIDVPALAAGMDLGTESIMAGGPAPQGTPMMSGTCAPAMMAADAGTMMPDGSMMPVEAGTTDADAGPSCDPSMCPGLRCEAGQCSYFPTCKDLLAGYPLAQSGTFTLKASMASFTAYCDMTTEGGGWMMIARSATTKSAQFGWNAPTGSYADFTKPYALDLAVASAPFTEGLVGTSSALFRFTFPQSFPLGYGNSAGKVTNTKVVKGQCQNYPTMLQYVGFTSKTDVFFFRDLANDASYGLDSGGWWLNDIFNLNCDYSGKINGQIGWIMVR